METVGNWSRRFPQLFHKGFMKNEFKRLIKLDQVEALTGFKKSYLYSRIQSGDFPNPVHIGRSARWVESEVLAWVENMIELHRSQEVA